MAWFRVVGGRTAGVRSVRAALLSRGFVEGSQSLAEPGLILVERPYAELRGELRAASASGMRVLVAYIGEGTIPEPWALLRDGAEDVVAIGGDRGIGQAVARLARWAEVDRLVGSERVRRVALGDAPSWRAALREVVEIARFTASPMLITGETGAGKEVVARLVHDLDPCPDAGDLVLVDCTTVVPSLSGSEFFGHEKGAFTGAAGARSGAFARANGGTLFLDEVGELPITMQAELLRVVQEGAYKPVGGDEWQFTSFRLVAATNRDLNAEQRQCRFRSDLYFRLAGAQVHLPPLRDRVADIVPLFRHFFAQARGDGVEPELSQAVAELLEQRSYPGNVRDLRQLAVRAATRHVGDGPVTPGDIPPTDRPRGPSPSGAEEEPVSSGEPVEDDRAQSALGGLEHAIRRALTAGHGLMELKAAVPEMATRIALEEAGGPTAAARMLGVSRRAVDYRKKAGGRVARDGVDDRAHSSDASSSESS